MRRSHRIASRRGTVYLIVLVSVLIITIIGLSGLYAAQIQARGVRAGSDMLAARTHAEAAIEAGMALIQENPNWRTKLGNGDWFSDLEFGDGHVTLNARDPSDDDVTDSSEDPIVLRGTGTVGHARQMLEVELASTPDAVSSLDVAAHAGRIMAFDGARVSADAPLTSNDSTWASAASVIADVESAGTVIGSSYAGSVLDRTSERGMPSSEAVTALTDIATPITMDEIAAVSSDIAENGHANFSLTNWAAHSCIISHSTSSPAEGEGFVEATNRTGIGAGPTLDVTGEITNNQAYTVSLQVRVPVANTVRVVLITESGGGDRQTFVVDEGPAALTWTAFSGTVTPNWDDGDGLNWAILLVRSTLLTSDIHVDDVRIVPTTLGPPVIEQVALSADWNPYGATNAQGIYWIDCGGQDLIIRDCRIHGTLVLSDPGAGTMIDNSVAWTVSGQMPALVVNGDITIAMEQADLDEGAFEVNFNPTGFGAGSEDDDADDAFASVIEGLVYVSNDLAVGNQTSFDGVVIAGRDIVFSGDDIVITHDPSYASNPPDGFAASSRLVLDRRSWTKVVD